MSGTENLNQTIRKSILGGIICGIGGAIGGLIGGPIGIGIGGAVGGLISSRIFRKTFENWNSWICIIIFVCQLFQVSVRLRMWSKMTWHQMRRAIYYLGAHER